MYYVYMLTNKSNRVLYTGMTNDLQRRLYEHKMHINSGFTDQYNATKLVFYECTSDVNAAIAREKEIKGWKRERKNELVNAMNPQWRDLSEDWK